MPFVIQTGGMVLLGLTALRLAFRPPVKWLRNFIDESYLLVSRCSLPLMLAVFLFGFGRIGVESGGVFQALGALDRSGGIFVTGAVREVATWATAMVVAGVGGTAICADLGARKIREELDALSVLGVNPIKELVVPRLLALLVVTPLLNLVAILFITLAGIVVMDLLFNVSPASFEATFAANFAPVELFASVLKTVIFGGIIAVVCCYKGLNASGGPQGVGRAVNQAIGAAQILNLKGNNAYPAPGTAANPSALSGSYPRVNPSKQQRAHVATGRRPVAAQRGIGEVAQPEPNQFESCRAPGPKQEPPQTRRDARNSGPAICGRREPARRPHRGPSGSGRRRAFAGFAASNPSEPEVPTWPCAVSN
jgi:phospholipid/cholesterol/gamma-HCH transport system permease protein